MFYDRVEGEEVPAEEPAPAPADEPNGNVG